MTGTSINPFLSHRLRFQPWLFFVLLSDIEILPILFSKCLLITYILSPISVTALSPLLESQQPPSPACFQSCPFCSVLPLLFAPSSPIPQCRLSQDRPRFSQDTSVLSQTTPSLASLQASAYPSSSAQRPHSPAELALTHQPQAVHRVLRVAVHLGFLDSSHSVTTSRLCAFNPSGKGE